MFMSRLVQPIPANQYVRDRAWPACRRRMPSTGWCSRRIRFSRPVNVGNPNRTLAVQVMLGKVPQTIQPLTNMIVGPEPEPQYPLLRLLD